MSYILSLQSHVAYGYVGNCVASFVLQRMGYEVIRINTVQFSNHSGYGNLYGDIMSLQHLERVFEGLDNYQCLDNIKAVITGYIGDSSLGIVLKKWLQIIQHNNPSLIYCCDPVVGDIGRGVYVKDGVADFFINEASAVSNIMTPNHFELSYLTGIDCSNIDQILFACNILHNKGVEIVLVTSVLLAEENLNNEISMVLSSDLGVFKISTPKLDMGVAITGAGDMTASIFLADYLKTNDGKLSLELTATKVFQIFEQTKLANRRELALIQAQNFINAQDIKFIAEQIC